MDIGDLIPPTPPDAPGRNKTFGEEAVFFLAWLVFPFLTFALVSEMESSDQAPLAVPFLFTGLLLVIARLVRARFTIAALSVVVCAGCCWLALAAGAFFAAF